MADTDATYCARHARVESRLGCSKCGVLICHRCLVQTPVGARCPDCARVRSLPTFQVGAATMARATGAGAVLAGVIGVVWGLVFFDLLFIPYLPWIATIGIGYGIGEGISASVNRKRGRYLQIVAGASVLLSYVVAGLVTPHVFLLTFPDVFFLLVLAVGAYIAASRVG